MITNEKQYRATKHTADEFRLAIKNFDRNAALQQGIDPVIVRAQLEALSSQLEELEKELAEYVSIRSGDVKSFEEEGLRALTDMLIKGRIARGLSQKELALKLSMKEQQVQRYEAERYSGASLSRLEEVAKALQLRISFRCELEERPSATLTSEIINTLVSHLEADTRKEIIKRHWLDAFPKEETNNSLSLFFAAALSENHSFALHRKGAGRRRTSNTSILAAWQARVVLRAKSEGLPKASGGAWADCAWVSTLAELSREPKGPLLATRLLKEKGIAVIVERHLKHTYLDGAAMMIDGEVPLIALTLRWDRLDNFWFVLLHEIGHLMLHRRKVFESGFLDEEIERNDDGDKFEKEADHFARTALIPDEAWENSMASFVRSDEEVEVLASRFRVGASVVAGRIRRERNDYSLFTRLVGQGELSKLFEENKEGA